MSNPAALLTQLFEAERSVRRLHQELAVGQGSDGGAVVLEAIATASAEALALPDKDESTLRLVRLSDLLSELTGPRVVDLLVAILGSEEPEARHAAGEALEGLAYDRFKEVALGIERALELLPHGNLALAELPYLLAEVPEPGVMKLLGKFLKHGDPEAVAAAIEALVEVGDPAGAGMLMPLVSDRRQVQVEDELGDDGSVTVGDLATEAREFLADLGGKQAR
jgi:HEAT repeat protein